ncbi:MAG TPA: GntR family transcriptional regulator [Gaiellaceae bacterium]|jgi:GntR family transcriptional regulator|nr:GntR family transcriptional regulator [Gaiellaceae bacterium]
MSAVAFDAPMHRRIAESVRRSIRTGLYPPGAQLPSERELAEEFDVSRGTVRHALATLRAEGVVASRKGARGVVLSEPRAQSFSELLSFSAWARSLGEKPSGRVVELVRRYADAADAGRLDVREGDPVFSLVRVRMLGGTPVMIERTTFVESVGRRVAAVDLDTDSIYASLAEHGVVFAQARHYVSAIAADADDAALLGVPPGTPLLRQLRRTTSPEGLPLEWSDDRYLGNAVSFVLENSSGSRHAARVMGGPPETHDGDRD